jgi:2-polyprenyl-3-methyl-5-hydroxy-6-metoxy-1,4-benzoquinol methylase
MSGVEIHCIFCGKRSDEIAWMENGFIGRRCDCGLIYISPRPEFDEILRLYNSDEADRGADSRVKSEFAGRLNGQHRLRLIRKHLRTGALLEIGSGGGYFLDESRRVGFEPFSVELNLQQAKFIKEKLRIPVETNPFTKSSFAGIDFDIICHFDVVSHFYDPISEFKNFNKRLNEEGLLFFETGNGGDLSQRWLRFIGRLQYPQHLFLFSRKNIEQLCHQTGFEIINIYQYSISLQLFMIKLFQWPRAGIERFMWKKGTKVVSDNFKEISRRHPWWKALPLKGAIFLNFSIKYKIGRFLPSFGPQTIIYVAKKVTTVN